MSTRVVAVIVPYLALAVVAAAQETYQDARTETRRPRVALVLSGGGARGIAHIGALRALEEAGIPIDAIAANSMGAIVGGLYATGRTADQIEGLIRSMDWMSLFSGRPDRRMLPVAQRVDRYAPTAGVNLDWKSVRLSGGLLGDHRINRFLIENLSPAGYAAGGDFDRLAVPFRAVAGDLANGEPVVLARGDLALAVRASMSIPLVFEPIEWEGKKLVDGLIANNLPVNVGRDFGALVVVAVDISSPKPRPESYRTSWGAAAQVADLLTRRRYEDFSAAADVLVRPDLGDHSTVDYSGLDALIKAGYEATKASVPDVRARLEAAGVSDFARRSQGQGWPELAGARIASVRVEGNERASEVLTRGVFNLPVGSSYVMAQGLGAFDKTDAAGLFDWTWLRFDQVKEGVDVVLRVKDAPPNRAEVSVGYSEWEKARAAIRLRNRNTLGSGEQVELLFAASDAEAVAQGSLQGERLLVSGLGYRATVYFSRDRPRFFTDLGDEINRARFDRYGMDLALRSSARLWGLAEVGVRIGGVKTRERTGLDFPASTDRVSALFGRLELDTLDDVVWPEHGRRLAVRGEWSRKELGADRAYWSVQADGRAGRTLSSRLVAQVDGLVGLSGGDLPVHAWHRLGGAILPGYCQEELKGSQALAAALSLRYRVVGQLRLIVRGGAGNVFARSSDITGSNLRWGVGVGLYHPSPMGPVSFELGVRQGGGALTALSVGWN
jgi:NTE family protein